MSLDIHGTTVLCVKKSNSVVMISDGQVSMGHVVAKSSAKKVRLIGNKSVIAGFAGSVADAMALLDLLEKKLSQHSNQLLRSVIEFCKDWRTNKSMYRLEASLLLANKDVILTVGGGGDVLESENNIAAIGSGSSYAMAAATALMNLDFTAMEISSRAMSIAADMCIYTNHNFTVETLDLDV